MILKRFLLVYCLVAIPLFIYEGVSPYVFGLSLGYSVVPFVIVTLFSLKSPKKKGSNENGLVLEPREPTEKLLKKEETTPDSFTQIQDKSTNDVIADNDKKPKSLNAVRSDGYKKIGVFEIGLTCFVVALFVVGYIYTEEQSKKKKVKAYPSQSISNTSKDIQDDVYARIMDDLLKKNEKKSSASSSSEGYRQPVKAQPVGPPPKLIREAQRLLAELGYNPGPADGLLGRQTTNAVSTFQKDFGLPQNSKIDESIIAVLTKATNALRKIVKKNIKSTPLPPTDNKVINSTLASGQSKESSAAVGITNEERSRIENYCARATSTPGSKYKCIEREVLKVKQTGGRPDISGITQEERSQIESYCARATNTPGSEYKCIEREVLKLSKSY